MHEEGIGVDEDDSGVLVEGMRNCRQFAVACVTRALSLVNAFRANHLVIQQVVAMLASIQGIQRKGKSRVRERGGMDRCSKSWSPIVRHQDGSICWHRQPKRTMPSRRSAREKTQHAASVSASTIPENAKLRASRRPPTCDYTEDSQSRT